MAYFSLIVIAVLSCSRNEVDAFVPSRKNPFLPGQSHDFLKQQQVTSYTILQAKTKGKKLSMAQKRKKRGNKFKSRPIERPDVLDVVPKADAWEKTVSTDEKVQTMKKAEDATKSKAKSQAAALIATQRKSVDVLSHVKDKIQALPVEKILNVLKGNTDFVVFDDLLGEDLCSEIMEESQSMCDNNKLELDLKAGITSGEYATAIQGGQDQYADCPRSVEYVVCLTRHMSGALNKAGESSENDTETEFGYKLDETASIAGLRLFNRKARLSSLALLTGNDGVTDNSDLVQNPFGCIIDVENEEIETRKLTTIYYNAPDGWDKNCGGGVSFKDKDGEEILVEAKSDRLLIFSSEDSIHRFERFTGKDEVESVCSHIVTHLVRERE